MHLPQTLQKLCHNLDHHVYKEVATSLKSITKSFTATVTSHIYFCLGRFIIIYLNYFLLIRFPYLLFFSIISISTTGYSPLYKQITQVHLVQEITTNMKLLVTLPVRHKLLIFFFSIFLLFFLFNVLHFFKIFKFFFPLKSLLFFSYQILIYLFSQTGYKCPSGSKVNKRAAKAPYTCPAGSDPAVVIKWVRSKFQQKTLTTLKK